MILDNIVIYGVGKCGKNYIDSCLEAGLENILLTDSDSSLWNTEYRGLKINNPAEILWDKFDLIIIAVNGKFYKEISSELKLNYKIPEKKIISYNETVILSEKEIYNLGHLDFNRKLNKPMVVPGKYTRKLLNADSMNDLERFFFSKPHKVMSKWVHYFESYDRFFSKYRGKDMSILEIGVFKGGSLQMWRDYFKTFDNKIRIYGIDIDPRCKELEDADTKIYIGSQDDRNFLKKIKQEIGEVDILIDDGGHRMEQQIIAFEELFDLVADDGIYLCEDLHTSYMKEFGGQYKGNSFIEYSKNLIDYLHSQYSETNELEVNKYSKKIKYITYCDSMIFIEKRRESTKSLSVQM